MLMLIISFLTSSLQWWYLMLGCLVLLWAPLLLTWDLSKLAMSGLAEFILVSHLVSFQSWFPNILLILFGLQSWVSCTLDNKMAHSGSSSSFCKVFHIFLLDRISHSLVIWHGVWSVDILRLNHVDTMILFSHDHLVFVMMFSWCVCVESPSGLIPYPHL